MTTAARDQTLHAMLCAEREDLPRTVVTKSAMIVASHLIEGLVAGSGPDTVLVAGFQELQHLAVARDAYVALAEGATVVAAIRQGDELPQASTGNLTLVRLPAGQPMLGEWFVLALGPDLAMTLVGLDLDEPGAPGPRFVGLDLDEPGAPGPRSARAFDAVFTSDSALTRAAVAHVAHHLQDHLPADVARNIHAAVGREASLTPEAAAVQTDHLVAGMLARIEGLRREERVAHRAALRLHEQALRAADQERRRLAGALHDESLQLLLAASQDLQEIVTDEATEPVLRSAQANLEHGLHFLREVVSGLFVTDQPDSPLGDRLQVICSSLAARGRYATQLRVDDAAAGVVDDLVCHVVREVLTNAAKHASAEHVTVDVFRQGGTLVLEVADDGVGADPAHLGRAREQGHIGLAMTRQRIADAGGLWSMQTAPGHGMRVRMDVPVSDA